MFAADHMVVFLADGQVAGAADANLVMNAGQAFLAVLDRRAMKLSFNWCHFAILSLIRYCSGITASPR